MSVSALAPLFAPRGVVVVGASRSPGKLGAAMLSSLSGYTGAVAAVNTRDPDPAVGRYATALQAKQEGGAALDLAVLCVPASACAHALADAADAGVRAALVCSGGFAEAGSVGAGYSADLLAVARERKVRLLGPNTSGFLSPGSGLRATFVPGAAAVPAGSIAVVAASGGVNHALAFLLADAGLGVSLAVGLGNAIDVSAADVLAHLAQQEQTRAVALHVETVADGPRLSRAVSELAARVPVVVLVVGRSDVADFAASHTGALATSWRTTRAALRQAGAVLVDDEVALVHAVSALSLARLPLGSPRGVGVVTAQAGPGLLLTDVLRTAQLTVPPLGAPTVAALGQLLPPITYQRNPVDTGRPDQHFPAVLSAVAADPVVGLVAGYALIEPAAVDLPEAVRVAALPPDVPLLFGLGGPSSEVEPVRAKLHRLGVPCLPSPAALATAVTALCHDAEQRDAQQRDAEQRDAATARPSSDNRWVAQLPDWVSLDEDQAKTLLQQAVGLATPARRACENRERARAAFNQLKVPLVVKVLDAALLHKSDVGGVHLGITDAAQLEAALDQIDAITGAPARYLVEELAPPGVDLIIAARRDPVFGPVVLLGLGGTTAGVLDDVAVRTAPLGYHQAVSMLDDLAGAELLRGFRGGPVVNMGELARTLRGLGDLLVAQPRLREVEVNPVRVTRSGVVALDAVVLLEPTSKPQPVAAHQ